MKLAGNKDLRVQKTIKAIRTAFESMVCEMSYDDMTVKELCERACINKKTFYRYYETLDDLLLEYQREMVEGYVERTRGYEVPRDIEQIARAFCTFSTEQGEVYERITCSSEYACIREQMTARVLEERRTVTDADLENSRGNLLLAFVQHVGVLLYRQWIADGKVVSPEEFADITCELMCRGSEGYLGRYGAGGSPGDGGAPKR